MGQVDRNRIFDGHMLRYSNLSAVIHMTSMGGVLCTFLKFSFVKVPMTRNSWVGTTLGIVIRLRTDRRCSLDTVRGEFGVQGRGRSNVAGLGCDHSANSLKCDVCHPVASTRTGRAIKGLG